MTLGGFGPRARQDYRDNKRALLLWLLRVGKDPFTEDGYSPRTVRETHYKIKRILRWI